MSVFWQPGTTIAELEKQAIKAALNFYQGNNQRAADSLGISVRTIQNKLNEYAEADKKAEAEQVEKDEQRRLEREREIRRFKNPGAFAEEEKARLSLQEKQEESKHQKRKQA